MNRSEAQTINLYYTLLALVTADNELGSVVFTVDLCIVIPLLGNGQVSDTDTEVGNGVEVLFVNQIGALGMVGTVCIVDNYKIGTLAFYGRIAGLGQINSVDEVACTHAYLGDIEVTIVKVLALILDNRICALFLNFRRNDNLSGENAVNDPEGCIYAGLCPLVGGSNLNGFGTQQTNTGAIGTVYYLSVRSVDIEVYTVTGGVGSIIQPNLTQVNISHQADRRVDDHKGICFFFRVTVHIVAVGFKACVVAAALFGDVAVAVAVFVILFKVNIGLYPAGGIVALLVGICIAGISAVNSVLSAGINLSHYTVLVNFDELESCIARRHIAPLFEQPILSITFKAVGDGGIAVCTLLNVCNEILFAGFAVTVSSHGFGVEGQSVFYIVVVCSCFNFNALTILNYSSLLPPEHELMAVVIEAVYFNRAGTAAVKFVKASDGNGIYYKGLVILTLRILVLCVKGHLYGEFIKTILIVCCLPILGDLGSDGFAAAVGDGAGIVDGAVAAFTFTFVRQSIGYAFLAVGALTNYTVYLFIIGAAGKTLTDEVDIGITVGVESFESIGQNYLIGALGSRYFCFFNKFGSLRNHLHCSSGVVTALLRVTPQGIGSFGSLGNGIG